MAIRKAAVKAQKPPTDQPTGAAAPIAAAPKAAQPAKFAALRAFCERWQELLIWAPALLLVLLVLFYAIPSIDPRSGIDGFGDVFHLVVRAVVLAAAFFSAWLLQRTYLHELSAAEEQQLLMAARAGDRDALYLLILNRFEFGALVCLALYTFR